MQLAEMRAILNAVSISALLSLLHVSFLIERVNSRGNSAAGLDVPPRWRRLLPGFTAWQAVKPMSSDRAAGALDPESFFAWRSSNFTNWPAIRIIAIVPLLCMAWQA